MWGGIPGIALACQKVVLTLLSSSSSAKTKNPRDSSSAAAVPLVVVFGRPGSGKTTVADAAVEILQQQQQSSSSLSILGLDLDVCVPQWMRDNFAKGQYPILEERIDFAMSACDYVETSLAAAVDGAVVSFSFVNTDLRDIFRQRFPTANWYLMDTSEQDAADRILQREGHFYKGKVVDVDSARPSEKQKDKEESSSKRPQNDNTDWDFAPVTFDHVVLDGTQSVSTNADIVAMGLLQLTQQNVS